MLEDARREADAVRDEARRAGEAAGLESARETLGREVEQRMQTVLPALEDLLRQLRESSDAWRRSREEGLVHLARKIAERIVRRQLERDPHITLEWAREALELVAGSRHVQIRLNPCDHAVLGEHVAQLAGRLRLPGKLEVMGDATIEAGGCVVQTEHGELDQQLTTQLDRLEEELSD
jgi:flagellar assembly protein FliH